MMKQKILCAFLSVFVLSVFFACSDDDGPNGGKISVPKDQPIDIILAANETEGQIILNSNASISAWVSDVKDGAPSVDIDWVTVNQPHKDNNRWSINYNLQVNSSDNPRTAYIIVVAEDERLSFTITQSNEIDPDIPSADLTGLVEITCESFEDFFGNGSYQSDGKSFYTLTIDAGMPREMVHLWTDDLDNGPGNSGDSKCENKQVTAFTHDDSNIYAVITDYEKYLQSGREESIVVSRHQMELQNPLRLAKSGSYEWTDEPGKALWEPTYSQKGYIERMKHIDTTGEEHIYEFTWKDGLLMKIEEQKTGNTVTFSYADPSLENLYSYFDLNWVLPTELETLDFAAGDVTKIWTSFGYLGTHSRLYATEISEYVKADNITYTYRMNYELKSDRQIKVNVAHLMNGVQSSYKVWEIKFHNMN